MTSSKLTITRQTYRLPSDVVEFLDRKATDRLTSRNAELIRAVRAAAAAETAGVQSANQAPAVIVNTTARQGSGTATPEEGLPK